MLLYSICVTNAILWKIFKPPQSIVTLSKNYIEIFDNILSIIQISTLTVAMRNADFKNVSL
jgi:hypothetical protein